MCVESFNEKKIQRVIAGLEKRNMKGHYCQSFDEMVELINTLLKDCKNGTHGGSVTLEKTGILDMLKNKPDFDFKDRRDVTNNEDMQKLFHEAFTMDAYLMSTNAITEDGILLNLDGTGNRVAALIYGPKRVIIVAGVNKITTSIDEAVLRVRSKASPLNCMRLDRKTPCVTTGLCANCQSPDCICNQMVLTRRCAIPDRIHVILTKEEYGF